MTDIEYQQEIARLTKENEIKNDILFLTGHEIRTALTSIKWMLKMLLDRDFGPVTDEQKNVLLQGYDSNDKIITIVTDIINFSHTSDSGTPYIVVTTDVALVLDQIIKEFSSESFKRGIPVFFNKPKNTIFADIDIDQFKVCISNLISNALKYSTPGNGLEIILVKEGDRVFVKVKDQGIGIPLEEQQDIFNKFFRATNAKKKETIGSGLGLYISYRIAQRLNGTLTFESSPGAGTVFILNLPCSLKE